MTFNYNHITLVGRSTKNPDIRQTDGYVKSSFNLAVDRPYRKEDGSTETDFINIVMHGKLAEISNKYIKKGTPVLIEGRLQVHEYEIDSVKKWKTEVVAENFQILESITK